MKRLLVLLLLLFPLDSFAFSPAIQAVVSAGSAGAADYCAGLTYGSYALIFNANYPSHPEYACLAAGGHSTVTPTGSGISYVTNGITYDGAVNHYLNIVPPSGVTTNSIRYETTLKWGTALPTADTPLFEWENGSVYIEAYIQYNVSTGYRITVYHADGSLEGKSGTYVAASNFTADVDFSVIVDINSTNIYMKLGSQVNATNAGTYSTFTTPTTGIRLGEDLQGKAPAKTVYYQNTKLGASQQ